MRIVIDMQGAQSESRFRGIGRYTLQFVLAVAEQRGKHEILLVLSGLFPATIEPIRGVFHGILPQKNIRIWHAPGPVRQNNADNYSRREAAELIREEFIINLRPDVVHICSLFEGFWDDAVTSIRKLNINASITTVLYDLIPMSNPDHYFSNNPVYEVYYRNKLKFLKKPSILFTISESSRKEGAVRLGIPETKIINISGAVGSYFKHLGSNNSLSDEFREKLGICRSFILNVGGADPHKNLPRLIKAYAALPIHVRDSQQLVIVGKMPDASSLDLYKVVKTSGLKKKQVLIVRYLPDEELEMLYNHCSIFVFPSWQEGFGLPLLEAMVCGAVAIGANIPTTREVIGHDDALFDPFDVISISRKMTRALEDEVFRKRLRKRAKTQVGKYTWVNTANRALKAWEVLVASGEYQEHENRFYELLSPHLASSNDMELLDYSSCIALNQRVDVDRQLLVDISELAQRDAGTGIQRVVRNVLSEWLNNPPEGWRIEPVYASVDKSYRYARQFTARFMKKPVGEKIDEAIEFSAGDIFFVLDYQAHVQVAHREFFRFIRNQGVTVKFLVYDLLCVLSPEYFFPTADELFERWLAVVAGSDSAICISETTSDHLRNWIVANNPMRYTPYVIDSVHLGSDVDASISSEQSNREDAILLDKLRSRPSYLMVGTLESRKGHRQVLDAFETLWEVGEDINLVLVGKPGWNVDELLTRLDAHPQKNNHLIWLNSIDDELLKKVYTVCTCLIAASYGEGFGLPLVEASRHKLPIFARDIPIFREVAENHAYYFNAGDAEELAHELLNWIDLRGEGLHPKSDNLRRFTWRESAQQLARVVVGDHEFNEREC